MSDTDITPEVLPEESGNGGASETAPEALSLEDLNAHLGKQFPSKEAALKALKDTFNFAVAKEDKIADQLRAEFSEKFKADELSKEVSELKKNAFFDKHPEYDEYRGLINRLGNNPADVVASDEFKAIFGQAQEGVKAQKSRTVLDSNPQLGQAADNIADAREALKTGNTAKAADLAVESVISAYGLRK